MCEKKKEGSVTPKPHPLRAKQMLAVVPICLLAFILLGITASRLSAPVPDNSAKSGGTNLLNTLPEIINAIPQVSNWVRSNFPAGQTNPLANLPGTNATSSTTNLSQQFSNWLANRFGNATNGAANPTNLSGTNVAATSTNLFREFTNWLGTNLPGGLTNYSSNQFETNFSPGFTNGFRTNLPGGLTNDSSPNRP
ncbi:MAG: hypothetical protein JWR19_1833 [Pedosphaera sp.]|nr:hypothetical protein [Pedosphaera sp.]